eukprot:Hpha_TRINITY_DN16685_c5_g1::TRINITY_DN16685_c5_g1_i1::g.179027::m.179027/K04638/IFT57, HIPPI, ESRRBL1; intraflagellar transport protein 57
MADGVPGAESTMGITQMAGTTVMNQEIALVDDGTMDEIVEKLKLLDYQSHFIKDAGGSKFGQSFKPLNRVAFCLSDMTGQQSFHFASLAAWLAELCGARFAKYDQYQEDPNVTATNIVQALKELRLETKDIVPSKLVKGYGDSVLLTLNMLCDEALSRQRFTFEAPVYPVEKPEQDTVEEDAGQEEEIADDVAMADDSDDDDSNEDWNDPGARKGKEEGQGEMIESQVNPEQWRLELETVASKLKLSPQENMKDWRGHVEYISSMLKRLDGIFPEVRQSLANVHEDIQRAVEKIQKRESHFATHFQDAIEKYREHHADLKQLQGNYDVGQVLVQQQSARLNQLTEDLEHVKSEIQEREEQMTDSKPLINIKRALEDLKGEIKHMELRIGVLQHTVLHQTIAQNKQKNAGKGKEDSNAAFNDELNQ